MQRSRTLEESGRLVGEELKKAGCRHVRHVVVKGEVDNIRALVTNVSTDNEADAIVLLGGTGFGPRDHTCEALDGLFERRIEGFGDAYRRLLRGDLGPHRAMLVRATAGVFNQCLVFAMSGKSEEMRLATELLIGPAMAEAFDITIGQPLSSSYG